MSQGSDYLVLNIAKSPLTEKTRAEYFAFGRLIAIAFIKKEQLGILLPVFFFSKMLLGTVSDIDFFPEEAEWVKSAHNFIKLCNNGGIEMENHYKDDEYITEEMVNQNKIDEIMSKAPNTFMPFDG